MVAEIIIYMQKTCGRMPLLNFFSLRTMEVIKKFPKGWDSGKRG